VRRSFERTTRARAGDLPPALAAIRGARAFAAGVADGIAGVVVAGPRSLVVALDERTPIFPALLTDVTTAVACVRDDGRVVGTGPFRVESVDDGAYRLRRSPDWRDAPPRVESLEMRVGLEAGEIARELRAGELDLSGDLAPRDFDELLRDRRLGHQVVECPKKNVAFLLFRARGDGALGAEVRAALASLVRARDLAWQHVGRFAQPAEGLIPPGVIGHDAGRRRRAMTMEEAYDVLARAAIGRPLRVAVNPIFPARYRAFADALFGAWARAGVSVEIANDDRASYQAAVSEQGDVDVALMRWAADYDDPDSFTYELFHSRSGYYRHFFATRELDELLEGARATVDTAARELLYRRAETVLLDARAPVVVPLFHGVDFRVANATIHGLALRAVPPYVSYGEIAKAVRAGGAHAQRERGGVIHIAMAGDVRELDLSRSLNMWEGYSGALLFESLTAESEGAFVTPFLASEIVSEDGARAFRIRLRSGVRFHDGRPLTARDVRWSFERLIQARSAQADQFQTVRGVADFRDGRAEGIAGIEILSPLELRIALEQPVPVFPAVLAGGACSIVPEGTRALAGTWREGFVGTGPFRITRFEPGVRLEVEPNPFYWRRGLPASDGIVCTYGMKPEDIAIALREGRATLGIDFTLADADRLRSDPVFGPQYREVPSLMTVALFANARPGGPLEREETRRWLFGVDPGVAVHEHLGRLAARATSYLPPSFLGYTPARVPAPQPREPGAPIELRWVVAPSIRRTTPSFVEAIAALVEARGFRLVPIDPARFRDAIRAGEPDLLLGTWWSDYPDIDGFLYTSLHSRDGFHGRIVGSRDLDGLLETARQESDPMVRHGAYRAVEDLLALRASVLPLYHRNNIVVARPGVRGLDTVITPTREDYLFDGVWIDA
jgi:ABC-type transport system substrate-binding protein